ncbi:MAG TPA: DinB family protein [Fimbriimonas sp.]|nr:DinB family protein [Fimbriimonas sp.]
MNFYVLRSIEFGPTVLERILAQIPEEQYDARPDPDRFTLREAVAHLADWESIFLDRMRQVLDSPGCLIESIDEEELAVEREYAKQDVRENLAKFKSRRAETTQFVRSLTPDDFKKTCRRDQYPDMTLEDWANLLVCHDMWHLEHASESLT